MIRLATANVNGIRAAVRRGMGPWLEQSAPDVLTLQEVRAPDKVLRELVDGLGYDLVHTEAEAKGRAGVAILSKLDIVNSRVGNGDSNFDQSGRWIEADVRTSEGTTVTIASVYVHSGEAGTPKQENKYRFLDQMSKRMAELNTADRPAIITGDLNVGHTERDIKNWKGNLKKAGFLPEERAYFDRFFGELNWVDVHRLLAGDVDGPYTWWSWRGQAFDNDTGWRIDYQLATPAAAQAAEFASVDRASSWAERWSDHAPLVIDYKL